MKSDHIRRKKKAMEEGKKIILKITSLKTQKEMTKTVPLTLEYISG